MRAQGNLTKVQSLTESSSPGSPSGQSTQTSLSVQTFSDPLVPKQSEVFCHLLWAFLWPRPRGWKVLVEFPEMRTSSLLKQLSSGPHFPTQRKVLPVGQKPLSNTLSTVCYTVSPAPTHTCKGGMGSKGTVPPSKGNLSIPLSFLTTNSYSGIKKLAGVSVFLSLYTPVILIIPNMQASNLKGKATQTQCKTNLYS